MIFITVKDICPGFQQPAVIQLVFGLRSHIAVVIGWRVIDKERQFKIDREEKVPINVENTIDKDSGFIIMTPEEWNTYITNKEGLL